MFTIIKGKKDTAIDGSKVNVGKPPITTITNIAEAKGLYRSCSGISSIRSPNGKKIILVSDGKKQFPVGIDEALRIRIFFTRQYVLYQYGPGRCTIRFPEFPSVGIVISCEKKGPFNIC